MKKFGMEMKRYAVIHKLDNIDSSNKKIDARVVKVWFGIKARVDENE